MSWNNLQKLRYGLDMWAANYPPSIYPSIVFPRILHMLQTEAVVRPKEFTCMSFFNSSSQFAGLRVFLAVRRLSETADQTPPSGQVVIGLDRVIITMKKGGYGCIKIRNLNKLWHHWEREKVEYFTLADLWNSFDEWSAYGAYVPYLFALQIFTSKDYLPWEM
ncbi:hypothetical protein LOK49_LG11G02235 [Camellia lanceoleosa]|uniref:Uncharacterized protein n=1 Tax=Camellia lanceoleosa TaxID=1840588 RepID=A0ACC0G3C9_9ERIC|nr:hypothetical protein LOK49_LG11G02235 [Camellia lanceoleosa]